MSRKQKSHEQVHFGSPLVIGVDVHKNSYAVAILDEDGRSVVFSMPADNKAFVSKIWFIWILRTWMVDWQERSKNDSCLDSGRKGCRGILCGDCVPRV